MLHHGENSVIKFVIVDVEHDLFGMQVRFLTRPNDLGYIDSRPKQLEMLHRLLRLVFRVEDGEFSEHGHMRSLKTQASFHQRDQLVKEAVVFVLMDEFLQFLGMDDQVETANLGETEFSLVNTRLVDVLPDSDC